MTMYKNTFFTRRTTTIIVLVIIIMTTSFIIIICTKDIDIKKEKTVVFTALLQYERISCFIRASDNVWFPFRGPYWL